MLPTFHKLRKFLAQSRSSSKKILTFHSLLRCWELVQVMNFSAHQSISPIMNIQMFGHWNIDFGKWVRLRNFQYFQFLHNGVQQNLLLGSWFKFRGALLLGKVILRLEGPVCPDSLHIYIDREVVNSCLSQENKWSCFHTV